MTYSKIGQAKFDLKIIIECATSRSCYGVDISDAKFVAGGETLCVFATGSRSCCQVDIFDATLMTGSEALCTFAVFGVVVGFWGGCAMLFTAISQDGKIHMEP